MSLTTEDVKKIAHLARLGIETQDFDAYVHDLSGMLSLMVQMENLNTENVLPMAHPMEQGQRLRLDEVTEHDQHTQFQTIAPQVEDGLYLVPKVIE